MARYAKAILFTWFLSAQGALAASSASVDFSAQISDGSCELTLSDTTLNFGVHLRSKVQDASTVMMLPLTAAIRCSGATSPSLTVTGTPYTMAGLSRPVVFRDADSAASGVGFMVRRDTGGISQSNFYSMDSALANGEPVTLNAIGEATWQNESFLLGLVRAGSLPVTPGTVKAILTFTVAYE
jgi:type 1 fimbria pilin